MIDVQKKMEQLAEKASKASLAKAKKAENKVSNAPEVTEKIAQIMPLVPSGARSVPNGILRSALFSVVKRGRRRMVDDEIVTISGVNIKYSGYQLNQNDLTTWESILHKARGLTLGEPVKVTAYQLLKIQCKRDTGQNRQRLLDRIERLVHGTVKIETERYTYLGGLIHDAARDDNTHEWVIWLNPRLQPLFLQDQYTLIDWKTHLELEGKLISQWLHGFYATHKKPLDYKVETIKRLCGSETKSMRHFRESLCIAMRDVAAVTGWKMWIEGNLLRVKK